MTAGVADTATPAELRGFREVQRLAYACAEAVAAQLRPGVTEREAARMQRDRLRERGVRDWFHLPFAWFGDRTAFAGFRVPLQFFPTNRRLEQGMPFILDMAPVHRGSPPTSATPAAWALTPCTTSSRPTCGSTASSSCARCGSGARCGRSTRTWTG